MKKKQIKSAGVFMAAVLVMGIQAEASLLVRDEFNSAVAGEPANGIYTSGGDLGDAGNANTAGGTMVGFDSSTSWTDSAYIEAYANVARIRATKYSWTYSGREITTSMAGKTEAFGKAVVRQKLAAASASNGQMHFGFGSSASLGSLGGALIGYTWDGSNWDMTLRYRNTGDSVVSAVLVDNAGLDTQDVYWKMDDALNTINVWVDNNDYSTAADLTVTDWGATVANIGYVTFGNYETGLSSADFVYVYDMHLGDTGADVGMVPEPATVSLFGMVALGFVILRRLKM